MTSRIGIVTSDPAISAAIYNQILQQTPAEEQTDFVLYSRKLGGSSNDFEILEGTLNISNMDIDAVAFPEIEQDIISESTRHKVALVHNNLLPAISAETIEPIRKNLLSGTIPEDAEKKKIYDDVMVDVVLWADSLVELAEKGTDNNHGTSLIEAPPKQSKNHLDILASSPQRHVNGFIGLQGGMGPEAGLESFSYIAEKSDTAIVLDSSATMPNEAEYILELLESDLHHAMRTVDPTDRLVETRERLEKMKPDCIMMTCNTAHFFEAKIEESANQIDFVHIIEEGLKAIEPKENGEKTKLLLFATTASVNSKIFEDALERINRTDIQIISPTNLPKEQADGTGTDIIIPNDSEQYQINSAIWEDILENKSPEMAGDKFQKVINDHPEIDGVIMGCTEIKFGMEHVADKPDIILDDAVAASDRAMEIATEKSAKRSESPQNIVLINNRVQSENTLNR